jgi:hypothetical protein
VGLLCSSKKSAWNKFWPFTTNSTTRTPGELPTFPPESLEPARKFRKWSLGRTASIPSFSKPLSPARLSALERISIFFPWAEVTDASGFKVMEHYRSALEFAAKTHWDEFVMRVSLVYKTDSSSRGWRRTFAS